MKTKSGIESKRVGGGSRPETLLAMPLYVMHTFKFIFRVKFNSKVQLCFRGK